MALPVRRATPQVEFYFSDSNLPRDKFLLEKVAETEEGWVDIALISIFSRTAQLLKIVNKDPSKVQRRAARLVIWACERPAHRPGGLKKAACRNGPESLLSPCPELPPALRPARCQLCLRAARSTSEPWATLGATAGLCRARGRRGGGAGGLHAAHAERRQEARAPHRGRSACVQRALPASRPLRWAARGELHALAC